MAGPVAEGAGELLKEGQAVGVVLRHEGEEKRGRRAGGVCRGAWAGGGADGAGSRTQRFGRLSQCRERSRVRGVAVAVQDQRG